MKHVISASVENRHGVLARLVGLISGRGFNIETLNVAPTQDPTVSRLTLTVPGDDRVFEQLTKQLNKSVDVIKVTNLTQKHCLNRELLLVEAAVSETKRSELVGLTNMFDAKIVSVQETSVTIQLVGETETIDVFLSLLKPFKILDVSRSGVIAVARGEG